MLLGVSKQNIQDTEAKLVYEFGELNKFAMQQQRQLQQSMESEAELIAMEEEEERDRQSIEVQLKKYAKTIRYMFNKYCFSTGVHSKNTLFNEIEAEYQTCTFADLWKMCRELELADSITKDQALSLVKRINMKTALKCDIANLDFDGFKMFIVNLSHWIYGKAKHISANYLLGQSIEKMFQVIAAAAKRKGVSTVMFEDPDAAMINADPELMKNLNRSLLQNPGHPVPDNYRKVVEKVQQINYQLSDPIRKQVGEAWAASYEILADAVRNKFGYLLARSLRRRHSRLTRHCLSARPHLCGH